MEKSNLELFKQAISEGLSNKFDSVVNSHTDEIEYSEKHKLSMQTIIYGKAETKRIWNSKMKRIIAILVAAALLLTSCGIIFRNEIREIFEEFFVKLSYDSNNENDDIIKEVYSLGYLPDGYVLEKDMKTSMCIKYEFMNQNGDTILFEQRPLPSTGFAVDSESGYSHIKDIAEYEVYHRSTDKFYYYIWNDGKYSLKLSSSTKLSNKEIISILEGTTK